MAWLPGSLGVLFGLADYLNAGRGLQGPLAGALGWLLPGHGQVSQGSQPAHNPECQHSTEIGWACNVMNVAESHLLFLCLSFPFIFIPFGSAHWCLLPLVNQQLEITELRRRMGKVSEENRRKSRCSLVRGLP